jgi:predicted nuclease of restriction endonuclease-like (RecB) superfamily
MKQIYQNDALAQSQERVSRRFRDEFVQKNLEYQREILNKKAEKNLSQEPQPVKK